MNPFEQVTPLVAVLRGILNLVSSAMLLYICYDIIRRVSRFGKRDRRVVQLFFIISVIFAIVVGMTGLFLGPTAIRTTAVIIIAGLIGWAMLLPSRTNPRAGRAAAVVIIFLCLAVFNSAISWDRQETALRWVAWLGLIIALTKIARTNDGEWFDGIMWLSPIMFLLIYSAYVIMAAFSNDVSSLRWTLHMSGLYANFILATGLFAAKLWMKIFWFVLGFVWIFASGAGGALFTVPIMAIPFILYSTTSMPVKGVSMALILLVGGVGFYHSQLFTRFLDIKLNITPSQEGSFTGLDRLQHSMEMRLQLANYGLALSRENPFGTGLGNTYEEVITAEAGVHHVHDGIITLLIELGYPGFTVYVVVLTWVLWAILRNPAIPNRYKGFYFTYFFTILGRSLSENLTVFDLGTYFNILFLFMTCYLFIYAPRRQAGAFHPPGHRLPLPAPMLRPPLPPPGQRPMPWPSPAPVR